MVQSALSVNFSPSEAFVASSRRLLEHRIAPLLEKMRRLEAQKTWDSGCRASRAAAADAVSVVSVDALAVVAALLPMLLPALLVGVTVERGAQQRMQ